MPNILHVIYFMPYKKQGQQFVSNLFVCLCIKFIVAVQCTPNHLNAVFPKSNKNVKYYLKEQGKTKTLLYIVYNAKNGNKNVYPCMWQGKDILVETLKHVMQNVSMHKMYFNSDSDTDLYILNAQIHRF